MTKVYYIFAILGSIISFSPFISDMFYGSPGQDLDIVSPYFPINDISFHQSSIACLIIVIPSFLDLLIDLVLIMHDYFFLAKSNDTLVKPETVTKIFRFTMLEKFMFICGVASFSICVFPPRDENNHLFLLSRCCSCFSGIVLTVSVISFLERSTETFSAFRCLVMIFSICVGASLCAISYCFSPLSQEYITINAAGNILLALGSIFYLITCFLCLLSYYRQQQAQRRIFTLRTRSSSEAFSSYDPINQKTFENYVPFCHMVFFIIFAIVNVLLITHPNYVSSLNYCVVAGATGIFVTEMRVRKTELFSALVIFLQ